MTTQTSAPARHKPPLTCGAVTLSARAFRRLLLDTVAAAADDLPPLQGVYLHSTKVAESTTLTGLATDRFIAIQADAPAHGHFPGTFLDTDTVHQLITALTTRLVDDAPDTDVRLIREHNEVALFWDTTREVTVPVSIQEFPLAVLRPLIDQPLAERTDAASTLSEDYLNVIVQIAVQRDVPIQLIVPGGSALTHFTIGDHCQVWLMPAHNNEGT